MLLVKPEINPSALYLLNENVARAESIKNAQSVFLNHHQLNSLSFLYEQVNIAVLVASFQERFD